MMFARNKMLALVAGAMTCGFAHAAFLIDGTMNVAEYGNPVSIQDNATGFGDNNIGAFDNCNGSELDAMFVGKDANNLYIGLSGNIESNYNKMAFFLDCATGGQNVIGSPVGTGDFGYLSGDGGNPKFQGFTFEPGFTADFAFNITNGATDIYANYFTIGNASYGGDYLGTTSHTVGTLTGGTNNGVQATNNNLNILGVDGANVNNPGTVRTGAEFKIPLSILGNARCDFKIVAMVTGGDGYLSNQFLPGCGPGQSNFAAPSTVSLATVPGLQVLWLYPSVSGLIFFNDYTFGRPAPTTVAVEWINSSGNVVFTDTCPVGVEGEYKSCGPVLGGSYTVRIKPAHWLGAVATANTTSGPVTGADFQLINGDINNDNFVGFDDFDILSAAFGSGVGDPGYVVFADLNGDEFNGFDDFDILSSNFGTGGD